MPSSPKKGPNAAVKLPRDGNFSSTGRTVAQLGWLEGYQGVVPGSSGQICSGIMHLNGARLCMVGSVCSQKALSDSCKGEVQLFATTKGWKLLIDWKDGSTTWVA